MFHFYAYLSRMKHIKRWGLMRNTQEENIKEHSLDVAILAHGLALIHNRYFGGSLDPLHIMALAVFHETGEVITGDLATPIKYFNPQIKAAYAQIEEVAVQKIGEMLPEELREDYRPYLFHDGDPDYRWVKYADRLCAYIKCVEEVKSGNGEFLKAKAKICGDLRQIKEPAVQFFIENCLPSYDLTLDELN